MRALAEVNSLIVARTDGVAAGLARIIIGVAVLLQAVDAAHILGNILDESKLQVPRFTWLPVISSAQLPIFIALWVIAAVAFIAGWRTRVAGTLLVGILTYSITLDQQAYSNHTYLLILVVALLTLAGCGSRFSIDAATGRADPTTPRWPLVLIQIQLSIVYFFAAVSKINLLYISGALISANMSRGWLVPLPDALDRWQVIMPVAIISIVIELTLAFALWTHRYRTAGIVTGIVLHTMIFLTFPAESRLSLAVFGLVMFGMYVPFLGQDSLRRLESRFQTILSLPGRKPVTGSEHTA